MHFQGREATEHSGSASAMGEQKPISILVVEDDPVNRTLLEAFLSASTLSVDHMSTAECLTEALALLGERDFEVVLLDLNLPDSEGLKTLYNISNASPHTAVIVVTGEYGEELGLQAIAGGAQDYLVKACFNQDMLSKSIHYAIERKQMEEVRVRAFKELKQAHTELKELQVRLLQNEKLAAVGQMAAGVAHEINTPLGFVGSNMSTLKTYVGKICQLLDQQRGLIDAVASSGCDTLQQPIQDIKKQREVLKIDFILNDLQDLFAESQEGLQRIAAIVQNLRDFSRIDQAASVADYQLNEGIQTVVSLVRNNMACHAEIVTEFGEIPAMRCNASQINQAFYNILINATQALDSQTRADPGTITIKTYATSDEIVCIISDDGPGIPAQVLPKIFDPFFTTKDVGEGTGLGLSLSYDIFVNKHQGQITATSQVGQGAAFHICLPLRDRS